VVVVVFRGAGWKSLDNGVVVGCSSSSGGCGGKGSKCAR
jgi:hypothetical protein